MTTNKKNVGILIVDDESIIRMDLREILREKGYNVIGEAKNGLEVLEFCQNVTPDLIIMDIKMPEMDGLEVLKEMNKDIDFPKVPVIMLTAYNQPELIEKAISLGVFGYIVKPIRESNLLPAIEICLALDQELKTIQKEVGKLKETLEVRKFVEKAKGMLMSEFSITEADAFRKIQKLSMDTRRSMKDIALEIINNDN